MKTFLMGLGIATGLCAPGAWAGTLSKVVELETPMAGSKLFVPNDGKEHPGILLLHGSEGGSLPYFWTEATFLAAHGYSVLAYCCYNCGKTAMTNPYDTLENVNVDKTYDAFQWLKKSPHVKSLKTAVVGVSRGAEQALILAWKTAVDKKDLPAAIAVHAPSDMVVSGFTWSSLDSRCWVCTSFDLTCFRGSKDPNLSDWPNTRWNAACGALPSDPTKTPITAWFWNGTALKTNERIGIEHFPNPIFVSHGTDDEWWSHARTLAIEHTLQTAGLKPEIHIFHGEKHVLRPKAENQRKELLLEFLGRVL